MATSGNAQIDFTHWIMRLVAYIIDSILLIVVIAIIAQFVDLGIGLLALTWAIFSMLYFILIDVYWGTTVGKKVLGLQVQTEKGGRVSLQQSVICNISKIFILLPILDWLIAVVTAGSDRRQKYTDRLAGTTVIQTRQTIQSAIPAPTQPTA
jgi:uncharacterized RDD family membrane protein YckC